MCNCIIPVQINHNIILNPVRLAEHFSFFFIQKFAEPASVVKDREPVFFLFLLQFQIIISYSPQFKEIASQGFINNHASPNIVSPLPPFNRLFT